MNLTQLDITEKDLKDKDSTWHGPVNIHWHTAQKIQDVLDRHKLQIMVGMPEDEFDLVYVDIVPKPEEIDSSMLGNISYDATTQKLLVTFKGGSTYEYFAVERAIYAGLRDAESKGKFFHKHIKAHYRCKQVE